MGYRPAAAEAMQYSGSVFVGAVIVGAVLMGAVEQVQAQTTTTTTPAAGCDQYYNTLESCSPYLSNAAQAPVPACCSAIGQVQKESTSCLCSIVTNFGTTGQINVTRAKSIPQDCKLGFTDAVCEAAGVTSPTPTKAAPSPSSVGTPVPTQPGAASTITSPFFALLVGAMALVAANAFVHAP